MNKELRTPGTWQVFPEWQLLLLVARIPLDRQVLLLGSYIIDTQFHIRFQFHGAFRRRKYLVSCKETILSLG